MIKFFRKIRHRLLIENKIRKYLIYAIGEIALVAVGILIALSVNNWNEGNKDRAFELKMLTEILGALESDISYYQRMEKRLFKLDSAANAFINLVHEKRVFKDTLYKNGRSRWYFLRTGVNLQYNTGPYEALKSSGLNRISNDSLLKALINFYDFDFKRYNNLFEYYDKSYDRDVETLKSFRNKPFTVLENGKVKVYSKFPEDLLLNPDFLNYIIEVRSRANNSKEVLEINRALMQELHALISRELERN
jgi:hypothetical protein